MEALVSWEVFAFVLNTSLVDTVNMIKGSGEYSHGISLCA